MSYTKGPWRAPIGFDDNAYSGLEGSIGTKFKVLLLNFQDLEQDIPEGLKTWECPRCYAPLSKKLVNSLMEGILITCPFCNNTISN